MERYWKLTIIGQDPKRKGYVICKCDCGNIKSIQKKFITRQKSATKSCGCYRKEISSIGGKKTITKNSEEQINTNKKFNTNFQIIRTDEPPKNNTSGHKGVAFDKSRNKYMAYINVHDKRIYLGRYETIEDAIKARKQAEEKHYKPLLEELK